MANPYQLAELIAARLEARNIGIPILYAVDLPSVIENSQLAPAINIVPAGFQLVSAAGTVGVRESVRVVACTRFVNQLGGQGARQLAGPYLTAATVALLNYQPSGYSPIEFETPPIPQYIGGFGYYPLQFAATYEIS
jgi:hypothetical protein